VGPGGRDEQYAHLGTSSDRVRNGSSCCPAGLDGRS
jgi:hypothetical protein